jgi:hypothetical protein
LVRLELWIHTCLRIIFHATKSADLAWQADQRACLWEISGYNYFWKRSAQEMNHWVENGLDPNLYWDYVYLLVFFYGVQHVVEDLLPKASLNLKAIALRAIVQEYRPKLGEAPRSRPIWERFSIWTPEGLFNRWKHLCTMRCFHIHGKEPWSALNLDKLGMENQK